MGITPTALAAYAAVASAAVGVYSATKGGPKAAGQPASAKDPTANVYKDRNAQNALVQGSDSTGTGSLLSNPSNVAGNQLLGN